MENIIVQSAVDTNLSKKVLDKGRIRLLDWMGNDLSVVQAARVSNGESYDEASHGETKDAKLIKYLVKHRHGTPFEHTSFKFYVKTPLFVRSEWHRHRMASYNEISGRYVNYGPEFYIPDAFRIQSTDNKQGSFFPEQEDLNKIIDARPNNLLYEDYTLEEWNYHLARWVEQHSMRSYDLYQYLILHGVAKEMARMVLPANMYTHFYTTMNARGLMNFLSLRAAEDAQWEIRQYAIEMKSMFKHIMPLSYAAWEENGYIAP